MTDLENITLIGKAIEIDGRFCISFKSGVMCETLFVLHDGFTKIGEFTSFEICKKAIFKIKGDEND